MFLKNIIPMEVIVTIITSFILLLLSIIGFFVMKYMKDKDKTDKEIRDDVHEVRGEMKEIRDNYLDRFESIHVKLESNKDFFISKVDEVKNQISNINLTTIKEMNQSHSELLKALAEYLTKEK